MPKGYELDDVDLSAYGVILLKGSNQEILKSPAVKKNLLQNFKYQDGAIYDGQFVKFQTKDVNLKCLMRAPDFDTFWRNRDALLYDLTRLSAKTDAEGYEYETQSVCFMLTNGLKATRVITKAVRQNTSILLAGYGGSSL